MTTDDWLEPLDPRFVPRFAEPATFMRAPYLPGGEDERVEIGLVGVPFDFPLNRIGTRHGPGAIREMSRLLRRYHMDGESPFDLCQVADVGDAPFNPVDHMGSIQPMVDYFRRIADRNIAVVAAGGDHFVPYPIWKGIVQGEPIGVVHFDAHPDTYDDLYGNRYNHGTQLRRAVEEDLVDPTRVVSIGIRGTRFTPDDRDFNLKTGMRVITQDEYEDMGRAAVIDEVRRVVGDGPAYVTFDIDALDPVFCMGTGSPEPGGLSMRDAQMILRSLDGLDIIGGDVCEVSPQHDPFGQTALNGANLLFEILCVTAKTVARKRGSHP
jgi:guanidinopropionase